MPRKDPDVIHVGLNDRDAAWHDLYQVKISTGERTLLRKNTEKVSAWIFDTNGALRLALRTDDNGDNRILRVDADGFKEIYSCTVFETCFPIRFHKDGKRVYMMTNKGEPNLVGLVLVDVETRAEQFVESDPLKRADFGGAADFLRKLALSLASVVPAGTPLRAARDQPIPGTGPYRIADFDPDGNMRLVRNPHFSVWSSDARPDGYPDAIRVHQFDSNDIGEYDARIADAGGIDFFILASGASALVEGLPIGPLMEPPFVISRSCSA